MHGREGLSADATLRKALNDAEAFMTLRFKLPPGGDVPRSRLRAEWACHLMRSAMRCRNLSPVAFHRLTERPAISISMPSTSGAVPAICIFFPTAWTLADFR